MPLALRGPRGLPLKSPTLRSRRAGGILEPGAVRATIRPLEELVGQRAMMLAALEAEGAQRRAAEGQGGGVEMVHAAAAALGSQVKGFRNQVKGKVGAVVSSIL